MPNQDGLAISFEISHEQQSFRLLELPPALLELITSSSPPRYSPHAIQASSRGANEQESLSLKSGNLGDQITLNPASSHAVLCTNSQTFHVRQVQSSNTVFVIQPPETYRQYEEPPLAKTHPMRAIAQCASTLELIPASTAGVSLRQILPIYRSSVADPGAVVQKTVEFDTKDKISKQNALENIPLSPRQFDEAWVEVCAFEIDGKAWIPSANSLKGVWNSIISAATAKSIDLAGRFLVLDLADIVEGDGFPQALFDAVIERNRTDEDMTNWAVLAKDKCVSWVGGTLLEAQSTPDHGVAESEFLDDWKNQLPEMWRKYVALSTLKCKYSHPSKGRIRLGIDPGDPLGSAVVMNTNGKRPGKWHEKFKTTRR